MLILLLHGCWLTAGELDAKLARPGDSDAADSDDPDGVASIGELGPGDLVITEVMRNPSAVNDLQGEWLELHNASDLDVDLAGLRLSDEANDAFTLPERLVVPAGGYVVLGSSTDDNGGAPMDLAWWNFALANDYDEVIVASADETLDAIAWTPTWPGAEAAAMSLDPDAGDNDAREAWCDAVDAYGDGDRGTPGEANPPCP